jgi:hypothetical protein
MGEHDDRNDGAKSPEQRATEAAATFVNALNTIAAGCLVFSIGLVATASGYDQHSRCLIIASWGLLALTILAGSAAQATLPMHILYGESIFTSRVFEPIIRAQQLTFFFAMALLAYVLSVQLLSEPSSLAIRARTATSALARVEVCAPIRPSERITLIEMLRGDEINNIEEGVWHIRATTNGDPQKNRDIFVQAADGAVLSIPPLQRQQC